MSIEFKTEHLLVGTEWDVQKVERKGRKRGRSDEDKEIFG